MKRVTAFFSVRLQISGWVRLEAVLSNLYRLASEIKAAKRLGMLSNRWAQ